MQSKPDHTVEFEQYVRGTLVYVTACAWSDHEGFYRHELTGVYVDGVEIMNLMRDDDLNDLDNSIIPAICAELEESANDFVPERDAHRLGD